MKRQLYLFFAMLFVITTTTAQQQTLRGWWALKYSTSYNSQHVRAFDENINPNTGGGYFYWIKVANNASIKDIPGIQIRPSGTTKGYWRREVSGPICVDWFGPANSSSQLTLNNYYAQSRLDSMTADIRTFDVTISNYNSDDLAIQIAFWTMEMTGYRSCMFNPNKYYIKSSHYLPRSGTSPQVADKQLFGIEGRSSEVILLTAGITFMDRYPANQTDAETLIHGNFRIENFVITKSGAIADTRGLRLTCTYNSQLSNIVCKTLSIGIEARWSMDATITGCESNSCTTAGIIIDKGDWDGATYSNSQSNCVEINGYRDFGANGTYAIYIADASNVTVNRPILEGNGGMWGLFVDTRASPLVKEFECNNLYGETEYDSAAIFLRAADGVYTFNRTFFRSGGATPYNFIYVSAAANSYPQINLYNVPYWDTGARLVQRNYASGTTNWCWDVQNVNKAGLNTAADFINPANNIFSTTLTGTVIPASNRVRVIPKIVN